MRHRVGAALLLAMTGLLIVSELPAQPGETLLDQRSRWSNARKILEKDTLPPMGFKPLDAEALGRDSGYPKLQESDSSRSLLHRKLFQEHLFRIEEGPLTMSIDPLFDLELGKDLEDPTPYGDTTTLYRNQRGFRVQGKVGERLSFSSRFRESQVFLPRYLKEYADQRGVIPGQGRHKPFKGNGFDHSIASGKLSYEVAEWLTITGGHGKHFIGEGYRSLLLSDNSFNYPFLELEHEWWNGRIAYRNLYTGFKSLERMPKGDAPEALFKPKAGTFHYLDIRLFPWMRIGLFEGTLRQRWDDSTGVRAIDASTLSPVIFTNSLLQGFSDEHNVVSGIDLRARIDRNILLYGQFVMDDPSNAQNGQQIGARFLGIGWDGLDFLLEYNRLMPRTFTHGKETQHYGHYGQPLAHPLGTDLQELIFRSDLTIDPVFLRISYSYATPKAAGASDIIGPKRVKDPGRLELQHQRASLGLIVNPKNRSELSAGMRRRVLSGTKGQDPQETFYLFFSLRTSLSNSYSDL